MVDEPKYREIASDLEDKIKSGEQGWAPGKRLPPDSELATTYEASRNTVRQAIAFLLSRGVLEKEASGATLVRKQINPFVTVVSAGTGFGGFEGADYASEVAAKDRRLVITTPKVEIQEATGEIADDLQLADGSEVVIRHQERYIDDELWSIQTSYYPMSFVDLGANRLRSVKDITEGARAYLDQSIGVKEIGSHDTMKVRAPNPQEAEQFRIPEDGRIAVFETRQVGVDPERKPVRVTITIYPSDRNTFSMETGALAEHSDSKGDNS